MEKKEKDDWYLFLHNFKSAKDQKEKVVLPKSRDTENDSLLESIINKLKSDKDEIFRISLLIFIQENVGYLIEDSKTYVQTKTL